MSKKEKQADKGNSIENVEGLKQEFQKNAMPPRKLAILKGRLVDLVKAGTISDKEHDLMEMIFKRERARGQIGDANKDLLEALEASRCKEKCIVKSDSPPIVHHLKKDMILPYFYDFDKDRHVVFVEIEVPTEFQLSKDIISRQERGHFVAPEEYPKPRTRWERREYTQKEFEAWFDVYDVEILNEEIKSEEEAYKF